AQHMLKKFGYTVETVANGQLALDAVATAYERGDPVDVVQMDVQLHVLDGLEASRRLRQRYPEPAQRPWIIAMTANAMDGDREDCLQAGMDDYLSKPIRAADIATALRRASDAVGGRVRLAA
ncbi:MAG TPA: response regulator, partial [Ramlibacter sp.]|nr:response regulator [Ramlibacter sp.]